MIGGCDINDNIDIATQHQHHHQHPNHLSPTLASDVHVYLHIKPQSEQAHFGFYGQKACTARLSVGKPPLHAQRVHTCVCTLTHTSVGVKRILMILMR